MKKHKAWLPALLWMGVIFLMSAAPGEISGEQSGTLVRIILAIHSLFFGKAQRSPEALALLETLVRKAAHMTEYAILAFLYLRALRQYSLKHPYPAAIVLCTLYAASDEFHQAFVPERGPSPIDVMIDTAGACLGLAIAYVLFRMKTSKPTT